MLEDYGNGVSKGYDMREPCKPDYEIMIKNSREELTKVTDFLTAIFNYMGNGRRVHGKLAELIGELVCEERTYNRTIDELIKQQEKEA